MNLSIINGSCFIAKKTKGCFPTEWSVFPLKWRFAQANIFACHTERVRVSSVLRNQCFPDKQVVLQMVTFSGWNYWFQYVCPSQLFILICRVPHLIYRGFYMDGWVFSHSSCRVPHLNYRSPLIYYVLSRSGWVSYVNYSVPHSRYWTVWIIALN